MDDRTARDLFDWLLASEDFETALAQVRLSRPAQLEGLEALVARFRLAMHLGMAMDEDAPEGELAGHGSEHAIGGTDVEGIQASTDEIWRKLNLQIDVYSRMNPGVEKPTERESMAAASAPMRMAAASAVMEQVVKPVGSGYGVRCLLVDVGSNKGWVRGVYVQMTPSSMSRVVARIECDANMAAAAERAIRDALAVMPEFGMRPPGSNYEVTWWIDGAPARFEGASIGLALSMAVISAYTQVAVDRNLAVTGAVHQRRVVGVAGVTAKWRAVSESGLSRMVLPAENEAELPKGVGRVEVVGVSTLEEAVVEVFGKTLGLAPARRAPVVRSEVNVEVWVEACAPALGGMQAGMTRSISMVPTKTRGADVFRIGDSIWIGARAGRDCHLSVVNIGAAGNVTVLIPNRQQRSIEVRGGETIYFPGKEAGYELKLEGPEGRERVIVIASDGPIELTAADFGPASARLGPMTRSISVVEKPRISGERLGSAEIEFFVKSEVREVVRGLTRGLDLPAPGGGASEMGHRARRVTPTPTSPPAQSQAEASDPDELGRIDLD